MSERVSTTTLRDYLLSQPGAEVLPPETLEAYEREMTEQVIPDLLRRNRALTTRELLQRMIASAAVFSDGSGVVTGYKINTGALHQLVGRFSVPVPMNLPDAALAAHDAAQPGGEVEWIPPRDDVDEVPFREAVLNYGMRSKYAAREPTHQQLQWESNAFERVITELRKITPPPASQPAKQGDARDLFCEAIAWGAAYFRAISKEQWGEMRDDMAKTFAARLATHPAQATIKDGAAQAVAGEWKAVPELLSIVTDAQRYRYGVEHGFPVMHNQIHPEIKRLGWTYNEFEPDAAYYETADEAIDTAIRASRGEGL